MFVVLVCLRLYMLLVAAWVLVSLFALFWCLSLFAV